MRKMLYTIWFLGSLLHVGCTKDNYISRGNGKNRLTVHKTDVYRLRRILYHSILRLLHDKHPYLRTCQGSQVAASRSRASVSCRFSVRNVLPIEFPVDHMSQQHFTTPLRIKVRHPFVTTRTNRSKVCRLPVASRHRPLHLSPNTTFQNGSSFLPY